jgi:ketosteroid isomerase-like protein
MREESTTPDLLDVSRRATEAANTQDVDALMSFYAPDAVWEAMTGLGTHEGAAEIRRFFVDWLGAYEEFEVEVEEILDLGNGLAFTVVVQRGRPVGSTGRVQLRYATTSIWVDGLIARQTNHIDIDEARAAAERLAEERK